MSRTKANPPMTLCHVEPSPRAMKLVPQVLLPYYGWQHQKAGIRYPVTERSFRQTMNAKTYTDRGFIVQINDLEKKIEISFDASRVGARHSEWLASVKERIGIGQLDPQPYWGFIDLEHTVGRKLTNVFHVVGEKCVSDGIEFFRYDHLYMLKTFSFTKFLDLMRNGVVLVDIDARSGHNHGTKFRVKRHSLDHMYAEITQIF